MKYALSEVLYEVPVALPAALGLMYKLEEWSGCKNLLTNDQKYLEDCGEKYSFMAIIFYGVGKSLESGLLTSERIKTLMEGLTTLQNSQTMEELYRLYLETKKVARQLGLSISYNILGLSSPCDINEIFISIISEYLRGNKQPFSKYVTEAQLDKPEMAAYKLLWKFVKRSCY